jgi:hypothetical protein
MSTEFSFSGFKSSAPVRTIENLPVGDHLATIKEVDPTNDRLGSIRNPSPKSVLPPWTDATPQLAIMFVASVGETVRTIWHRFNLKGFVKHEDLHDTAFCEAEGISVQQAKALAKASEPAGREGYAVMKKTGTRIPSVTRTNAALNILNQFFADCGLPTGSEIADLPGSKVMITVEDQVYEGKTTRKVTKTRPVLKTLAEMEAALSGIDTEQEY